MASVFCKSAIRVSSRSLLPRSRNSTLSSFTLTVLPPPSSSSSSRAIPRASWVLSSWGSVESLMPLHTTIASARLISNIAVDPSCWSSLSRGLAKTL